MEPLDFKQIEEHHKKHRQWRRETVLLALGVVLGIMGNISADFLLGFAPPDTRSLIGFIATIVLILILYGVFRKGAAITE